MRSDRRFVLGLPVDPVTEEQTLAFVRERVSDADPAQIVTLNPEMVMRARADERLHSVILAAELVTADGAGILWALARQGCRLPRRVGGSDLVWSVSSQAAELGHRVFLLGGRDGVASAAARTLQSRYPRLVVAGAHAGSPAPECDEVLCARIHEAEPDIVFVAFGAPAQEIWIRRNLPSTGASVAIGVGGSLDYLAGTARRAPRWMQDHGLEWLWRLIRQPWRGRRMLALPRFAWLILTESDGT